MPARGGHYQGAHWIRDEKRWAVYWRDRETHRNQLRCVWCRRKGVRLSLDHLTPWVHGGTNDPSNLVTSCHRCNASRGSSDWRDWVESSNFDAGVHARVMLCLSRPLNLRMGRKLFAAQPPKRWVRPVLCVTREQQDTVTVAALLPPLEHDPNYDPLFIL